MENNKHESENTKYTSKKTETTPAAEQDTSHTTNHPDEEHAHGNYMFAFKVLCILLAIILIIVILKASGVPIAIKDWLAHTSNFISPCPFIFGFHILP